jgi:hypothetical protein
MLVYSVLPPLFQELLHIRLRKIAGQLTQIKISLLLRVCIVCLLRPCVNVKLQATL